MKKTDQIEELELTITKLENELRHLGWCLREEQNEHFRTQDLYEKEYTMRRALESECGRKGWELI